MSEQERFEIAYENTHKPIIARPYPKLENGLYQYLEIHQAWDLWQAATAQAAPQVKMFYALKDEYFEGQYFELGCVIDDFESDYGGGDILEVLCAEITTVKHPNKFITTPGHGKTQLFDTSEEAKQAIKAAQENDQ